MTTVFADTFLWLALVHPKDAYHNLAKASLRNFTGKIVTSEWVLVEVGDALSGSQQSRGICRLARRFAARSGTLPLCQASRLYWREQ